MAATLGYEDLVRMLNGAVQEIRDNHEILSKLDSVGGDGDHGSTMLRAMNRLEEAAKACATPTIKTLLYDVGWAILGVDGGATGPLLGTLFMSMSEVAEGKDSLDSEAVALAFEQGLKGVTRQTKARPGDKTMIDALTPAVEALRTAAGEDVSEMLERAAAAAQTGAESTAAMQARFGRAKNIKEQSIGHQDPGATSMAFLFLGFSKGIQTNA